MNNNEHKEVKVEKESNLDKMFPIIKASTLSIKDHFLHYEPHTSAHARLRDSVIQGIMEGLQDFRYPIMDPSIDKDGNLFYQAGHWPAVYRSAKFWDEKFQKFMPEKNSRMATLLQRDVFLVFLIKYLVEEKNYTVAAAWEAVNYNSKHIGHYINSKDAKYMFEKTGSRPVGEFYDLANTVKFVKYDNSESGYGIMGGDFRETSGNFPLSCIRVVYNSDFEYEHGVGIMVMDP